MSVFSLELQAEYESEYRKEYPEIVKKYTEPQIYHGGNDYDLSRRWYVYYSYLNPESGKMERQTPLYYNINKAKTKKERMARAKILQRVLKKNLEDGATPYESEKAEIPQYTAESSILFAIEIKKKTVGETSYNDYRVKGNNFINYLKKIGVANKSIKDVSKKHVLDFLNEKLNKTTPTNRNSFRRHLSALFQVLEDEEYVDRNFIKSIPILRATPVKNKAYTLEQADMILNYLEKHDKTLLLLIQFMSYNFLRPVEACRLKVEDLDLAEKTLTVKTKTKASKTKRIPDIMIEQLQQLNLSRPNAYLITLDGVAESKETPEHRRKTFSKRFTKVRDKLELSTDYTLYSFRHTFITKLYRELRKDNDKFATYDKLMPITGHATIEALEKYLRDIDAELPDDYSDLLKK